MPSDLIERLKRYGDEFVITVFGKPRRVENCNGKRWFRYEKDRALSISPDQLVGNDFSSGDGGKGIFALMVAHNKAASTTSAAAFAFGWLEERERSGKPPTKARATNHPRGVEGRQLNETDAICACIQEGASWISFPYSDASGELLYVKQRLQCLTCGEKVCWYGRVVSGRYKKGLAGIHKVPYALRDWSASPDPAVSLAEGEPCADVLRVYFGQQATTVDPPWTLELAGYFRGRDVTIYPDRDPTGQEKCATACEALAGIARSINVYRGDYSGLNDVADYVLSKIGSDKFIYPTSQLKMKRIFGNETTRHAP